MVRHEIQEQVHASTREFLPGDGQAFRVPQVLIDYVASHAIG